MLIVLFHTSCYKKCVEQFGKHSKQPVSSTQIIINNFRRCWKAYSVIIKRFPTSKLCANMLTHTSPPQKKKKWYFSEQCFCSRDVTTFISFQSLKSTLSSCSMMIIWSQRTSLWSCAESEPGSPISTEIGLLSMSPTTRRSLSKARKRNHANGGTLQEIVTFQFNKCHIF